MDSPKMIPRLAGPDVWDGKDMQHDNGWLVPLNSTELTELDLNVKSLTRYYDDPTSITREHLDLPALSNRFKTIQREIEGGRGFQVLRGLPVTSYSLEQNKALFWILSLLLGDPQTQDKAGNLMHSVTNTGKSVYQDSSTRGYETDSELTFHNDGGDVFMLLCLKTAASGGVSKLVSVANLFNRIVERNTELADVLCQPFCFDSRNQNVNEQRLQVVPIMNFHDGKMSALYKRQYIETAQRFPETPRLTTEQIQALDLLDEICNDKDVQLSFSMQPGDVQIGNNYSILHSRTKYQDHADPEQKRYLLRTWLTLPNGRPLPRAFEGTREFGQSYAARMRT